MCTLCILQRDDTCCWKCRNCPPYYIKLDDFHCEECKQGFSPDSTHSNCLPIPEKYIDYTNPLAIGALSVSAFGKGDIRLNTEVFTKIDLLHL